MKGHAKKYVKKGTELPKFKPLPTKLENERDALKNYFATFKTYARFYGEYLEMLSGKRKRFSFQVSLSGREKYENVRSIHNCLHKNRIPMHNSGQIFSYHELMHHTHWIPVRKLLQYEGEIIYD